MKISTVGSTRRDIAVIVTVSVAAAIIFVKLNLSETLFILTRADERFQLDELPFVLLVIAVCLIWFSLRRYSEAQTELVLRRRTEAMLESTLNINRRLAQQYVETQESERKALARDLHDEMGQYLNVIKLDAVTLRRATAAGDPASHELAHAMIQNIDRVYGVVTGLIRQLRPVALDELGLAPALQQCVVEWRRRLANTTIELSIHDSLEGLDESRSLALFRLVQEALTNAARHSRATRVTIRITRDVSAFPADVYEIAIEDDGVGTDLAVPRAGLGLIGMRERLAAIGGSLTVRSAPRQGFALTARLAIT